jgi:hypothetical protein
MLIIVFWALITFTQVELVPQKDVYGNAQGDSISAQANNVKVEKKYQVFTSTTDAQNFINTMPGNAKDVSVFMLKEQKWIIGK